MATINTQTNPDFVAQGEIIWRKAMDELLEEARSSGLFYVENFGFGNGDTKQYSSVSSDQYAQNKAEGAQAEEGRIQQGFGKELNLKTVSLTYSITKEMRDRNKYRIMEGLWKNVGTSVQLRRDLDMQHRVGFGTAISYVDKDGETVDISTGDGKALFATDHEVKGSSTTYRNRLAGNAALSAGSLEGMEKMIVENTIDEFGLKKTCNYDILYTSDDPNTVNTARRELNATAETAAPNEGVPNVNRGKYRHEKLSRIATDANGAVNSTKAKYWGLCSSANTPLVLSIENNLDVETPAVGSNAEDILTGDWVYKATGSYGIVATDGGGLTLSSGDGAA